MKVLAVTRAYGAHQGGMERLSYELLNELQQQSELTVTILSYTGTRLGLQWWLLKTMFRVPALAKDADVIHLGDPVLAIIGWLSQVLWQKPVAVTVHGLDIVYPNFLYQLYLNLFARRLTAYWAISHYAADLLKTKWPITDRIKVLLPGVYDQLYQSGYTRADLSRVINHPLTSTQTVFLTTGRLIKRKGVGWFIDQVLTQLPTDVMYVVAGAGPEIGTIQEIVNHHALQDRVFLVGRVSAEQLRILYNTVDAFIQPNIAVANDAEGFGLVLVEAALCARPVFAAKLEGITDAVADQQTGTLLPSGDATVWQKTLQDFIANKNTWQPSGEQARTYSLQHSLWSQRVSQYVAELKRLAQSSKTDSQDYQAGQPGMSADRKVSTYP